jgi:hypothetical protein
MRKSSVAVLAALVIVAVVLSAVGCGSKKASPNSAKGILEKSQQALLKAKSVKVSGTNVLITPEAEEKESKDTFTGEFNIISTTDVEGHVVAQDDKGEQSEAYTQGGYAYTYTQSSGWEKQKTTGATDLASGLIDLNNLSSMIKYAENLKKLPVEGNNYVISFDVGNKFYQEMLSGVEAASSAPTTAEQSLAQQYAELLKGVIGDIKVSLVMKIDKTSYLPAEATAKASAKDIPLMGDVRLDSKMAFTDYSVPVTITLPPEAANAKEVETGVPTGIPGFSGLGL